MAVESSGFKHATTSQELLVMSFVHLLNILLNKPVVFLDSSCRRTVEDQGSSFFSEHNTALGWTFLVRKKSTTLVKMKHCCT